MMSYSPRGASVQTSALDWLHGAAKRRRTKWLACRRRTPYYSFVPDKEGNGFSSPITQKRTDRAMRFFYVRMPSCALYGRRWQGSLRARWLSFVCRSTNPVICRSPRLVAGRGLPHTKEALLASSKLTSEKSPTNNIVRLAGASALGFEALAIQGATNAVDMAALGESCVHELRAILAAIVALHGDNAVIHDLAQVGLFMANDKHNVLDCSREEMEGKLAALTGANRV
jgi:hypothetical protein